MFGSEPAKRTKSRYATELFPFLLDKDLLFLFLLDIDCALASNENLELFGLVLNSCGAKIYYRIYLGL